MSESPRKHRCYAVVVNLGLGGAREMVLDDMRRPLVFQDADAAMSCAEERNRHTVRPLWSVAPVTICLDEVLEDEDKA